MSEEMYARGEWIVHARYGVGQVEGKDSRTLEGEEKIFLRVKTFTGEYFLPIKKWDVPHIRPLSSEYKIKKALSLIGQPAEPLNDDYRIRNKQIAEAISDISIYSKAEIIRDLYARKRNGKLNTNEADLLEKIKDQFLNEWSIVTGLEKGFLREKLVAALQVSFDKFIKGMHD